MLVSATTFQNEIGKFFELVKHQDIHIQKYGEVIATLTSKNKSTPITEKYAGILRGKLPKDITAKELKEERLKDRYGI
jgi:hypothetical protein